MEKVIRRCDVCFGEVEELSSPNENSILPSEYICTECGKLQSNLKQEKQNGE